MTLPAAECLLLTCDASLTARLARAAGSLADVRGTASRTDWSRPRSALAIPMLDLRHPEAAAALAGAGPEARHGLIVFGVPDSTPFLSCHDAGLFAVEPLEVDPERFRTTLRHALLLHLAQEEVSLLREQQSPPPAAVPPPAGDNSPTLGPLQELWRASRHVHDIQKLLDQVAEGVASACRIARVGVFARLHDEATYRLWSGLRCLEDVTGASFAPDHAFIQWLERHAHLVCRAHLTLVPDLRQRRLLQQMLDNAGAELIVPLLGRNGLLGWIFVGHRITGIPFTAAEINDLTVIGEQVATLLDNAVLMEELAVQKKLAETLLEALPVGILATSGDGTVRWFNRAAEGLLGLAAREALDRPVERVGSRLADMALRTLHEEEAPPSSTWTEAGTQRTLRADACRLEGGTPRQGAMLLLSDVTRERLLREKQEELDRHAFWSDLAAAMSHEVRNPLVAISTFAQLLPERYADPEFRQQFFSIVTGEVARLNSIITQLNAFAQPRQPCFRPADPAEIARQACTLAAQRLGLDKLPVACDIEPRLPPLAVDAEALTNALAHLLVNAQEAVRGRTTPKICLHLRLAGLDPDASLLVSVSDNGPGLPDEVRHKLFSPFATTKPQGMGLGLPLAHRAAVDHGGRIDLTSTDYGTTVTLTLPLNRRTEHAETAGG